MAQKDLIPLMQDIFKKEKIILLLWR